MNHTENMERLGKMIAAQTKGHEGTVVEAVGQQLLDIAAAEPACAEILVKDLEVEGMGIADAEGQIAEAAKKNRKGNVGFVSGKQADQILRKFYGLPEASGGAAPVKAAAAAEPAGDLDIFGMLLED